MPKTETINTLRKKFPAMAEKIRSEAFARLPWNDVSHLASHKFTGKFHEIILVGMGGSSLGVRVLSELFPGFHHMTFLDNVEPGFVASRLQYTKNARYILSSKSGETAEVLALAQIILSKKRPPSHSIVITDNPSSTLAALARKHRIPLVLGNKKVPGRFSIFSETSLLPFLLSEPGFDFDDVEKLLDGAKRATFEEAFELAVEQYLHYHAGKNITVLFSYGECFSTLADWYIQLLSESIGKTASVGITPVKASGVRDQHSQLQLFLDGPKDKFFLLLKNDFGVPNRPVPNSPYTLSDLFDAEYEGVKGAMQKKRIPFREFRFKKISPENIGHLLFLFELQVAFLGLLLGIDYKNQPAVELSKSITKKFLNSIGD